MVESEAQKSPCARRFLRSSATSSAGTPNIRSSNEHLNDDSKENGIETVVKSPDKKPNKSEKLPNHTDKETNGIDTIDKSQKLTNGTESRRANNSDSSNTIKNRVSIRKTSLTPPVSSSSTTATPQRTRRSQSAGAKRTINSTFSEFEKACLKAHNEFRAKHVVAPLKLSKRLCRFAEEWAKVIYFGPDPFDTTRFFFSF